MTNFLYLDTETTGLSPANGDIVEVAIVDGNGNPLIDTLLNPGCRIPREATRIHGITDDMVRGKPTLRQIMPRILDVIRGQKVVIYNAKFDVSFFPGRLDHASAVECAMVRFSDVLGGRWRKLDVAANHVGHIWTGTAHRALADALACRSVWLWLEGQNNSMRRSSGSDNQGHVVPPQIDKVIILCRECAQRLRVPAGKHLKVTCPRCRCQFPAST